MVNGKWVQYHDIVNHTKTGRARNYDEGKRKLYLTKEARHLLDMIRLKSDPGNEYIFMVNGKILPMRAIDYRIHKYCDRIGIPEKSLHDLRRTGASRLKKAGMSYEAIQKILGHTDVRTTMMYIFDYTDEKEQDALIESALQIKAQ